MKNPGSSSAFTKNLLTLFMGNAVAFIFPLLLYPVVSRIFSVEDYALFGVYFSIFSLLEIASAGRYDFGVVMPEEDKDAVNLVAGGLMISLVYSLFILVLVLFFRDGLATELNSPSLANWLFLLPMTLFLISVSKLCNGLLLRAKRFRAASVNKASQKIAEVSAQLSFGLLKSGNGLILGDFAGRIFNATFSVYQCLSAGFDSLSISRASIKANLLRYIELPKFGIWPSVLNTLGGMLPVFIISSYYTVEITGSYNFSRIVLAVPFALISTGVSQILMQQVSERKNKNEPIQRELFSLAVKLMALSLVAAATLVLAGPILFETIFGSAWRISGEYTRILIFSTAISFVVSPFTVLLVILGQIRGFSIWQVFYFLGISILWLMTDLSIERFLTIIVVIDMVSYLVCGWLIVNTVRRYEKGIVHPG